MILQLHRILLLFLTVATMSTVAKAEKEEKSPSTSLLRRETQERDLELKGLQMMPQQIIGGVNAGEDEFPFFVKFSALQYGIENSEVW